MGSVYSSQKLLREIDECIEVHDKLLEFSKQGETLILPEILNSQQFVQGTTISNQAFEQAVNTPLPPSPAVQRWTFEESNILQQHLNFYHQMIEVIQKAQISGPWILPKPPKRKLQDLFNEKSGKKKARKEMTMEELHNYLCANCVDIGRM